MNPFLWDKYTASEANEKVRYWVDLWESLVENLSDPLSGFVYLNPHLLVRQIADEVVFNNFRNTENREFFLRQLNHFVKEDPATKKLFSTDFSLIRREFSGARLEYLLQLCRSVDLAFSERGYLEELFSSLRVVLGGIGWQAGEEQTIRTICQCMIVELNLKGYSFETIKLLPAAVFGRTSASGLSQRFPSLVNCDDFIRDGELDYVAHRAALDAVPFESRLNAFADCFHPSPKEVYFIFRIEGLRGDTLDITIDNVNLYSPTAKRYIKSVPGGPDAEQLRDEELFGTSGPLVFANAAVRLREFDAIATKMEAVGLVERALDLFRTFIVSELPFKVMTHSYIRVSLDGEFWGYGKQGLAEYDDTYKHYRSIDLTKSGDALVGEKFLRLAGEHLFRYRHSDSAGLRLAHSLHWYRKAEESETPEDRLLGYWIVLENIVSVERSEQNVLLPEKQKETKFSLIREFVSSLDTCVYLSESAAHLYRTLFRLLNETTNGRPHLVLPAEILSKALLARMGNSQIDLSVFVSQLCVVADAIDRKSLKDQVVCVHRLHTDVKAARDAVHDRLRTTKDDLLMLYRLRNRIVHNAHYDNSQLPLWVAKAERYAGNTLRYVLDDVIYGREQSIERSLLRCHVALARVQEELENGIHVDFLRWKW